MKKEITLGQLLSVAVTLLIAVITGWITMSNKVTYQETKFAIEIENIKAQQAADKKDGERYRERVELKLDKINENVNSVLIKMESKLDRQ